MDPTSSLPVSWIRQIMVRQPCYCLMTIVFLLSRVKATSAEAQERATGTRTATKKM